MASPPRAPPTAPPPETPPAVLERARVALSAGRLDEAIDLATSLLEADAGNVLAAQALGHALVISGRPKSAIEPLRAALRRQGDAATETLLGRALAAAGDAEGAIEVLRRTTGRRPPFALAFIELGDLYARIGRLDEASAVLAAGLALAPDFAALKVALGRLHLKRNDRAAARRIFAEVAAAAPRRLDALEGLAKATALEGDLAAAAELYRRALTLEPGDGVLRIELARCLLEMGDRDGGEAALRAVARGDARLVGLAATALAAASHGRLFLRPSAAADFLGVRPVGAPLRP